MNLIPSENTPSRAVRLLCGSDPACRYAEHKKILAFYDKDVFYYQGTEFIDHVEQLLIDEMRAYLGCSEVETRVLSGQMANMAVFSSLMDWKNRVDRKSEAKRLGYVMNNHIIKGGHLSAQPMGALHDYVAIDPVTGEKARRGQLPDAQRNPTRQTWRRPRSCWALSSGTHHPGQEHGAAQGTGGEIRKFVDEQNIHHHHVRHGSRAGSGGRPLPEPLPGAEIVTGSSTRPSSAPAGASSASTTRRGRFEVRPVEDHRTRTPAASPTTTWAPSWVC